MRRVMNRMSCKKVCITHEADQRLTVTFFLTFAHELHTYNNVCEGKNVTLTRHFVLDVILTVTCSGMGRVGVTGPTFCLSHGIHTVRLLNSCGASW